MITGTLLAFLTVVAVLLFLLVWALRAPETSSRGKFNLSSLEESGRRHSTYFGLIRQASSPADMEFLAKRAPREVLARVRKDRRRVALLYLGQLREDFQRLLRLARAVAALSPSVGTRQELERFWLLLEFSFRYQMVRAGFYYGMLPMPQLSALSHMVSELAVQMENSMKDLGERAAMAAKIASSFDGNSVDVA
jgi:hypothetical protein